MEPKRRRRREAKAQRRTPSGGNFDFREELARAAKGKIAVATGYYRGRRSQEKEPCRRVIAFPVIRARVPDEAISIRPRRRE
jgi:hypothetical protein